MSDPTGPIPAKHAVIHYRRENDRSVSDVAIHDARRVRSQAISDDDRLRPQSLGAWSNDWMTGEDARSTPEGVFLHLVRAPFSSPDEMLQALQEFGRLEECEWARTMAAALHRQLKAERD